LADGQNLVDMTKTVLKQLAPYEVHARTAGLYSNGGGGNRGKKKQKGRIKRTSRIERDKDFTGASCHPYKKRQEGGFASTLRLSEGRGEPNWENGGRKVIRESKVKRNVLRLSPRLRRFPVN